MNCLIVSSYSSSNTQYVQTITVVTSSVNYHYISQSVTTNPSQSVSLTKLRIINLDTVSGEIYRVKTLNKSAASQLDFAALADTPTTVGELLVTSSIIINEREVPIGIFNSDNIVNSNWYGYLMTGSAIPDPSYYDYTVSSSLFLKRTDNDILDAVYVYTTASNYFFGTKNNFTVFPTSEYTCKLDAYVYTTSASYAYTASQYNADIYLVGSAIANRNPLGLKIGTLTTNNKIAYFKDETFNFTVPLSGSIGIRIVPRSGFWEFANISMKVAEEIAFSPDEVTLIIPNENKFADTLLYKTSFYDINNNALGLDAISQPTYFTGSRQYVLRSGDTMWGRLDAQGGLTITGSTYIASGSDFYRWGNKQFNYGEWYTTASLTAPSANTPYSMSFDHTSYQSGFSIVSGSRIVAQNDGLYNLQFSAQLYNTANTTIVFSIWFAKNQTDLPNTATDVEIAKSPGTTGKRVASWNLIQYLESGSYIELRWGSDQTTGVLLGLASSSLRPAVPSLIATITQVT